MLPFTLLELETKDYSPIPVDAVAATLQQAGIDPGTVILWVDPKLYGRLGPSVDLLPYEVGIAEVKQLRAPAAARAGGHGERHLRR